MNRLTPIYPEAEFQAACVLVQRYNHAAKKLTIDDFRETVHKLMRVVESRYAHNQQPSWAGTAGFVVTIKEARETTLVFHISFDAELLSSEVGLVEDDDHFRMTRVEEDDED